MPGWVAPMGAELSRYMGRTGLYEFVNSDGRWRQFNCGQAAACTIVTAWTAVAGDQQSVGDGEGGAWPNDLMRRIEKEHPPDNLGGWLGSSRRRVERILRSHGVPWRVVRGERALRAALAAEQLVVVMVQTPGVRFGRWRIPGGHWIVLYGYDDERIFCTNWNEAGILWPDFRAAWSGWVPRVMSMRQIGLAMVNRRACRGDRSGD